MRRGAACCAPTLPGDSPDVHRPLRARSRRQASRPQDLARYAVRRADAGRPALAGLPAAGVGAGQPIRRDQSVPDTHVRRLSHLAQLARADRVGRVTLGVLTLVLAAAYVGSLFSPPPPMPALAIGAMVFGWLFVVGAWWGDGHRETA